MRSRYILPSRVTRQVRLTRPESSLWMMTGPAPGTQSRATASSELYGPTAPAPGTICQLLPFQCSMKVLRLGGVAADPTAQTSFDETAETAPRLLNVEEVFGLETICQADPVQCSMRDCVPPVCG